MRLLGRIAGKLARPTAKVFLAAILCTVLLSLAACSGEQGLPAGDFPAPTETTAVTQRQTEPATPAALPKPLPTATPALRMPSTPAGGATAASIAAPTTLPSPAPTPEPSLTPRPTLLPPSTPTATPLPTPTPAPTATLPPTAIPTATPAPTATPPPTPIPVPTLDPALAGYSPLLVEAVSGYTDRPGFVSGSLTAEEKQILEWADSRIFSNESFNASEYGPANWPSEVKRDSARAVLELMQAIDIEKKSNGKHVVSWEKDSLDRIMDELDVYKGMCVRCYDRDGYDTIDGIKYNYVPIIRSQEYVHRKTVELSSYYALADGIGILVRPFTANRSEDFRLLFKRKTDKYPNTIAVGADAYENIDLMSQIELPDGTMVSLPTMAFEAVADAKTQRGALGGIFDYARKKMKHFTGDHDDFVDIYRPYTTTPFSPELGWVIYTGEAGSQSSSSAVTGLSRAVGFLAEQFRTLKNKFRAGSVEADGKTYYYNGNDFLGSSSKTGPTCRFFQSLEQVENYAAMDMNCDK